MKNLDQRVVRTHRILADALITLALEPGYVSRTIKAVTELAGVGYRMFYSFYRSLGDLLATNHDQRVSKSHRACLPGQRRSKAKCWRSILSSRSIQVCCASMSTYRGEHPARQAIMNDATQLMRSPLRPAERDQTRRWKFRSIILFWLPNSLVTWYLDHIDDYTPEQAAEFHDDLVTKGIELRDDGNAEPSPLRLS